MYRILVADDEGIVLESVSFIIKKEFSGSCEVEVAKSGKDAIEKAEEFRPDILLMDISMPGISGIEAIREIKQFNGNVVCIIMSAHDNFKFAQEAIQLNVLEYMNKPVNKSKIIESLHKAMKEVDRERVRRDRDLTLKEKLKSAASIIENGLIYTILFQEDAKDTLQNFANILEIDEQFGFIVVLEFGELEKRERFASTMEIAIQNKNLYLEVKEIAAMYFHVFAGPIMGNRIVCYIPCMHPGLDYEKRIEVIENTRKIISIMQKRFKLHFRAGIGSVKKLEDIQESYQEAFRVLRMNLGSVGHIEDQLEIRNEKEICSLNAEKNFIKSIQAGNYSSAQIQVNIIYEGLRETFQKDKEEIILKTLELLFQAEGQIQRSMGVQQKQGTHKGYLESLLFFSDIDQIRKWFLDRVKDLCDLVSKDKKDPSASIVGKGIQFIEKNFNKEISLNEVSRHVNVSPYYFSKLFKNTMKKNFIEYLSEYRIEKAKDMIDKMDMSIKEVGIAVGYPEPSYFSKIFRRYVGISPSEYKDSYL